MFTGLVEEVGRIQELQLANGALRLTVAAKEVLTDLKVDDSVAVDGVCLTATAVSDSYFQVEAVEETLRKTTLARLKRNAKVNLERALRFSDRLGGHLMQGHVDAVAQVSRVEVQSGGVLLALKIPPKLAKYAISEGSIGISGVSLTIARLNETEATISLIPHTLQKTNLGDLHPCDQVNIEVDLIGKYVEKLVMSAAGNGVTEQWLQKLGYPA